MIFCRFGLSKSAKNGKQKTLFLLPRHTEYVYLTLPIPNFLLGWVCGSAIHGLSDTTISALPIVSDDVPDLKLAPT